MYKKMLLILICFFAVINITQASSLCSYDEERSLEQEAANVKIAYEPVEEIVEYPDGIIINKSLKVSIYNINEHLYITLNNEGNDKNACQECLKTITFSDTTDGVATFEWNETREIANFVVNVYSSNATSCPDEKFKTLYLTLPKINDYAKLAVCDDLKDFYLCQNYVTFDEVSKDEFFMQINKYKNKSIDDKGEVIKDTFGDKVFEFINKNKYIIIGIFAVVGCTSFIMYTITVKKQKELGL